MSAYLFSYGTLQKEKVQLETFGRVLKGTPDALMGYKLSTIEITDPEVLSKSEQQFHLIAILTNQPSDVIEGVVFVVSEGDLEQADEYEESQYKRVQVKLRSGIDSWVYVEA